MVFKSADWLALTLIIPLLLWDRGILLKNMRPSQSALLKIILYPPPHPILHSIKEYLPSKEGEKRNERWFMTVLRANQSALAHSLFKNLLFKWGHQRWISYIKFRAGFRGGGVRERCSRTECQAKWVLLCTTLSSPIPAKLLSLPPSPHPAHQGMVGAPPAGLQMEVMM